MRWFVTLGLSVVIGTVLVGDSREAACQTAATPIAPPIAARKPVRLTTHGVPRIDDYAWLRDPNWRDVLQDPSRLDSEIRAYIDAENKYADAILAPLAKLQVKLIEEMKGRIEQFDSGVPTVDGPYAYWSRYQPGAEHLQLMRGARDGGSEQVLVDGPVLSAGKAYFSFGAYDHSPDHRLFGYAIDETGSESFTLRILDVESKRDLPDVITGVSGFAWADSATLYYVRLDDEHRARSVYRHKIGSDQAADQLCYEEKDAGFTADVSRSRTGRHTIIKTGNFDTSEIWLIDNTRAESTPALVAARARGTEYYLDDWGDRFVIRTNVDGAEDFKLVTAPLTSPGRANWRDLLPAKDGRQVLDFIPFAGHLAILERENGLHNLVIYRKADGTAHTVAMGDEVYWLELLTSLEFDTKIVRLEYSSPATPRQTVDYDMEKRERFLRKEQKIPSGHDPSDYVVRRLFAMTTDNEQVPITLLHRKGLVLDNKAPLFMEGYGGYSYAFETSFGSTILPLVDRGFVYAIAHIRGGWEKGERWHKGGYRENKANAFKDFIAVAEHLIKVGYTASGRIVARGDSNGGLLMGAVANMRPDLFAGMIARVPYVDTLNTFLDDTLPLTASGYSELGNPIEDVNIFRAIAGYAPYENVKSQPYPHMLITGGLSDARVQYWEPAKWVAKLRAMKTNDPRIALVTSIAGGHFGAAGRFEWLEELALIQAFTLDALGLAASEQVAKDVQPRGRNPNPALLRSPPAARHQIGTRERRLLGLNRPGQQ